VLERAKRRTATEELHEVKRHPDGIRYTLQTAFCWLRAQGIRDKLAELLCDIVHRIGSRSEKRVENAVMRDIKPVYGKGRLLFCIAQASLKAPEGQVREIIFPVVGHREYPGVSGGGHLRESSPIPHEDLLWSSLPAHFAAPAGGSHF